MLRHLIHKCLKTAWKSRREPNFLRQDYAWIFHDQADHLIGSEDRVGGGVSFGSVARVVGLAVILAQMSTALAASEDDDKIRKGIASSFAMPLSRFVDGTAEESLSVRLALDLPFAVLQPSSATDSGAKSNGTPTSSPTLQVGLKYVPLTSWFFNANFLFYFQRNLQKSWNPDFTYAFGYDDWRPYTFSAQYANFGGNRLQPNTDKGEQRTNFMGGTWNVAFKFPLPAFLNEVFLISPNDSIGCTTGISFTPRYSDLASNSMLKNKRTMALGCKYSFPGNWYFNFSLNKYLEPSQKQPWDPDFTYGFGYFDWRPGAVNIQYNNYSGNRFPGSPTAPGTGSFKNGSITISTNFAF